VAELRSAASEGRADTRAVEGHLATLYLPQLIRHTQIALDGMKRSGTEVFVKVVVTAATREEELDRMTACIAAVDPATPLVVQPVTPFGAVREGLGPERLLALATRISRSLSDVRLIPQTHKLSGAP